MSVSIEYRPTQSDLTDDLGNRILVEDIFVDGEGVGDLHYEDGVYLNACYHDRWPLRFVTANEAKAWVQANVESLLP